MLRYYLRAAARGPGGRAAPGGLVEGVGAGGDAGGTGLGGARVKCLELASGLSRKLQYGIDENTSSQAGSSVIGRDQRRRR